MVHGLADRAQCIDFVRSDRQKGRSSVRDYLRCTRSFQVEQYQRCGMSPQLPVSGRRGALGVGVLVVVSCSDPGVFGIQLQVYFLLTSIPYNRMPCI